MTIVAKNQKFVHDLAISKSSLAVFDQFITQVLGIDAIKRGILLLLLKNSNGMLSSEIRNALNLTTYDLRVYHMSMLIRNGYIISQQTKKMLSKYLLSDIGLEIAQFISQGKKITIQISNECFGVTDNAFTILSELEYHIDRKVLNAAVDLLDLTKLQQSILVNLFQMRPYDYGEAIHNNRKAKSAVRSLVGKKYVYVEKVGRVNTYDLTELGKDVANLLRKMQ